MVKDSIAAHVFIVGNVFLPDIDNVDEFRVRQGTAWWYQDYAPKETKQNDAQEEAQQAKRGLWAEKNPIAPWDWRKGER